MISRTEKDEKCYNTLRFVKTKKKKKKELPLVLQLN